MAYAYSHISAWDADYRGSIDSDDIKYAEYHMDIKLQLYERASPDVVGKCEISTSLYLS